MYHTDAKQSQDLSLGKLRAVTKQWCLTTLPAYFLRGLQPHVGSKGSYAVLINDRFWRLILALIIGRFKKILTYNVAQYVLSGTFCVNGFVRLSKVCAIPYK